MPDPFAQQTITSAAPRNHQGRKVFGGRYILLRPLGRGGMGEVWLAQDNELGVQRALKFAPPEVAADARSMAMLKREAIAGTSLAHPNIVRIFDFATDPVAMESAVVMEVVEGKSLAELQAKRIEETGDGFFEPEEMESWLHDACAALDYAHGEGRVHRDLKPQNLMVETATKRLKIMDFGISRRIGDSFSQLTGKDSSGTLPYMSPQQLLGDPPNACDDIYGLGATLYDLLSGSPPFIGGALEIQIREKAPSPILQRRAEVNGSTGKPVEPAWEAAVMACLAKNRDARPANMQSVWQAFSAQSGPLSPLSGTQAEPPTKTTPDAQSPHPSPGGAPPQSPPVPLSGLSGPLSATKEAPFTNSLGMKFVPVPVGAGPSQGHRVLFSIWQTRSKDYAAYVEESGHDGGKDWRTYEYKGVPVGRGAGEKAEDSSHPVHSVSLDDAMAFCVWLTTKERAAGHIGPQDKYRLPGDVEWSYAVGIGEKEDAHASPKDKSGKIPDTYPWGGGIKPGEISGNYADTTARAKFGGGWGIIEGYADGYATTAPVGSFKANALGLYDLGGNLWEWTSSVYETGDESRALRGGSWLSDVPADLLSSGRRNRVVGDRRDGIGFRCVLVVSGG